MERDIKIPAILCVEDNPDALNLLVSLIKYRFPESTVYSAQDGSSGLRIFIENQPGIVITDLAMQGMDGFELAGNIRQLKSDTVIVGVSAHSRTGYDKQTNTVFDHYLHKPLNFGDLSGIIEQEISRTKKP